MEKHHGAPNDALKMFQLAEVGSADADQQVGAVITALSATAYQKLGYSDKARSHLQKARVLFSEGQPERAGPFFAFYGNGAGVLAAGESKLGDFEVARVDVTNALRARPEFDVRCNALDTIVLATTNIQAGELRDGIPQTQRALKLLREVGSQRVRDRLKPLEAALVSRNDSTCQDLARVVRQVRTPSQTV
jgi:tetratricopeptide (TPR) repeat protein